MKNYTVKIIAIIALIAAMTSCTNVNADMTSEPAVTVKTSETEITVPAEPEVPAEITEAEAPVPLEPTAAEEFPIPEGMQRINYPVSEIDVGIHSEAHKPQENTSVTMNIPSHLKYINDTIYFKYNSDSGTYSRSLDIGGVFEVEDDFEFTGTIHQTGPVEGAWNPYEEDSVTVGTTSGGRSYEIYRRDHENHFRVHVYALVDDDHVVSFTYGDYIENIGMIEKMIDSASVEIN